MIHRITRALLVGLLLVSTAAMADPITITASLAAVVGGTAAATIANALVWAAANWIAISVVALNVYGSAQARRKAKAEAAKQRRAYNAGLTDRAVTALSATPPWRVVYGECIAGGDIVAVFTSDKAGVRDDGTAYVKKDGYKHLVITVASHELTAIDDVLIEGVSVGTLDGSGWVQNTALGTGKDYVLTSAYAAGTTVLGLSAGTGTILVGDEISIAGSSKRYSVTGALTAGNVTIAAPGLEQVSEAGTAIFIGNEFAKKKTFTRTVSIGGYGSVVVAAPVVTILEAGSYGIGDGGWVSVTPTLSEDRLTITNPSATLITVSYTASSSPSSVRVSKHLGTVGQTVDPYLNGLFPVGWDADHRLDGHAYVVVTLDLEEARFQGGPPAMAFAMRGKAVYDPRTSTTAYSTNPSLVIRDFLINPWGFNCVAGDIDDAACIAAANDCDVATDFTVVPAIGSPVVTSAARYTCNGAFTTDDDRESVLNDLCESMAGYAVYGAQWSITAGVWTPPVTFDDGSDELTDDDLDGQIEIVQAGAGLDTLFNGVRGIYIGKGKLSPTDFEPYQNATFRAVDGEDLYENIELPYTNENARCKNIARIMTERNRDGQVITYPAKLKAFKLVVGDRVRVSSAEYGFVRKTYRVTDWQFGMTTAVMLTLQEDTDTSYDFTDSVLADPSPNTMLANPWIVEPVTNLTAESGDAYLLRQSDGTVTSRVKVSWDAVTSAYVAGGQGEILVRWKSTRDDDLAWKYANAGGDDTSTFLNGVRDGDILIIGVTVVNSMPAKSVEVFISHAVAGTAVTPLAVGGLTLLTIPGGMSVTWLPSSDSGYLETELRYGADWASGTFIWAGSASGHVWVPPSDASYTVWAVHRNTSELESTPVSATLSYAAISGNSATVYLYQRTGSAIAPSQPAEALTYTFATGLLSGGSLGLWTQSVPASGDAYLWVTQVLAFSVTATDAIAAIEWTAARLLAQDGSAGTPGTQSAQAYLYNGGTTQPADPTGASTITWATGANSAYTGANGWTTTPPVNPGTPGWQFWVASKGAVGAAGATTSSVSWTSGFQVYAAAANGTTGPDGVAGAPGVKAATPTLYQWAATIPTIAGSNTYTWSTAAISDVLPTLWTLTPGTGLPGQTLWGATVQLVETAGATTSSINWVGASITARGYQGEDGAAGSTGATGATGATGISARRAYVITTATSLGSGTVTTTGINSLPPDTSYGASAWSATPTTPTSGQTLYQSDGLYNPATDQVTWATPYISALKVGNLAAITVNTGALTVDGSLTVGTTGNIKSGATSFSAGNGIWQGYDSGAYKIRFGIAGGARAEWNGSAFTIYNSSNQAVFSSGGTLNWTQLTGTIPSTVDNASVTLPGLGYTGALNANVGAVGGYVNTDPMLQSGGRWSVDFGATYYQGFNGGDGLQNAWDKVAGGADNIFSEHFPVSPGKTYLVTSSIYMWAANTQTHYLAVAFFDANGTVLNGSSYPTGWPSSGTFHYYGLTGTVAPAGASTYSIQFGALATAKIPANAVTAKVGILGGYGGAASRWSWGGARVREVVDGSTLQINTSNISTYIDAAAIGSLDILTTGKLRSGKTNYGSGTGYILEYNGGTPRLDIGNDTAHLRWDGSELLLKSPTTSGVPVSLVSVNLKATLNGASGTCYAYVYVNSDGTVSRKANTGSFSTVTGANWYNPTTSSIGTTLGLYARLQLLGGGASLYGDVDTWKSIAGVNNTSSVSCYVQNASIDVTVTAYVKVDIATDSAGENIIATGFYTLAAKRTNIA